MQQTASALQFSNPMNFMLYSWKLNLGATIQDLQTKQVLQIRHPPSRRSAVRQQTSSPAVSSLFLLRRQVDLRARLR